MRISDLADLAQVPVSTVRYYERIGLLQPPERSENGYRVYDESAAEHLAFIGRAKRMGVPLDEVAELIELWTTGGCRPLQDRLRSFLAHRIAEVRAQRTDLVAFEQQLRDLAARLEGSQANPGLCDLDCECVHLDEAVAPPGGCSQLPTGSQSEITCALDAPAQRDRIAEWHGLLSAGEVVDQEGHVLRIAFPTSAEFAGRLARLCAAEVTCCSFLRLAIEVTAKRLVLVVDAPDDPEAGRLLDALFGSIWESQRPTTSGEQDRLVRRGTA